MSTFLYVTAGVVVGGLLLLVVLFLLIKFLIRRWLGKLVDAIKQLGAGGVPPFRISLSRDETLEWKYKALADQVVAALVAAGYESIGEYRIDEIPAVRLRALMHATAGAYAAVYEHDQAGLIVDLVSYFVDGGYAAFTTAPETGLDKPDWSRQVRVQLDLAADPASVATLHEQMLAAQQGHMPAPVAADAFEKKYCAHYAREMDWRIARGGVTADEVRCSVAAHGGEPPSDEQVAAVQEAWRMAIGQFVNDQLAEKFPRSIPKLLSVMPEMTAAKWEVVRDRLYFVHEHSYPDLIVDQLAEEVAAAESRDEQGTVVVLDASDDAGQRDDEVNEAHDQRAEAARTQLKALFAETPVREAFVRAQELLPAARRYRRLIGIKTPFPADVYVAPVRAD